VSRYIIESNIPVPMALLGRTPLSYMEVGDSFVAPITDRAKIASTMTRLKNKYGMSFTSRSIDEKNIRVWRLA
jgi:hypothetical protein